MRQESRNSARLAATTEAPTGVEQHEGDGESHAEAHHRGDAGADHHAPEALEEAHGGEGGEDHQGGDQHGPHHPHAQHNGQCREDGQQRIVPVDPDPVAAEKLSSKVTAKSLW